MDDILNKILNLFDMSDKSDMELEKEIGLPRSTVYMWRNGKNKSYRNYIAQIALYFGLSTEYFFDFPHTENAADLTPELDEYILKLTERINEAKYLQKSYLRTYEQFSEKNQELKTVERKAQDLEKTLHSTLKQDDKNDLNYEIDNLAKLHFNLVAEKNEIKEKLDKITQQIFNMINSENPSVMSEYFMLNNHGKEKAEEYIRDILENRKYRRTKGEM